MGESFRADVCGYVKEKYGSEPEHLWASFPDYVVFRHGDNRKWYAAVMDVPGDRLGLSTGARVDLLNVKMDDPLLPDLLTQQPGILRGYHFSRGSWISIVLDGTVPMEQIRGLIDISFRATASAKTRQKIRPPKQWIIPANPRYFDIVHAFDDTDELDWKQGKGIKEGDTVLMYVGAPVSAVLYRCLVTKTEIPFHLVKENLRITALMRLKLLERYPPDELTFEVLKSRYGIYAVRGPRTMPERIK